MKMIVFSGAACGGKSTVAKKVLSNKLGIIAKEAARDLFSCEFIKSISIEEIQKIILAIQIIREQEAIKYAAANNIKVIICDRGILDGMAFCSLEEMEKIYKSFGIEVKEYVKNYSLAFLFESMVNFNKNKFMELRPENKMEVEILREKKLLNIWSKHVNTIFVKGQNFNEKVHNLIKFIENISNQQTNKEIQPLPTNQVKNIEKWLLKELEVILNKDTNYERLIRNNKVELFNINKKGED